MTSTTVIDAVFATEYLALLVSENGMTTTDLAECPGRNNA